MLAAVALYPLPQWLHFTIVRTISSPFGAPRSWVGSFHPHLVSTPSMPLSLVGPTCMAWLGISISAFTEFTELRGNLDTTFTTPCEPQQRCVVSAHVISEFPGTISESRSYDLR
jgi:hypothetical protein